MTPRHKKHSLIFTITPFGYKIEVMRNFLTTVLAVLLVGCNSINTPAPIPCRTHKPYQITNSFGTFNVTPQKCIELEDKGTASYYGKEFHGRKTATGAIFNMHAYTAAHKTAHLPSVALVTHGDQSRIVLINDRGPFAKNRILDCSHGLAQDLGFARKGHAHVTVKVLKNETLALKQNGGHIHWDGTKPFPLMTKHTKNLAHFCPTMSLKKLDKKAQDTKRKMKISIMKLPTEIDISVPQEKKLVVSVRKTKNKRKKNIRFV